jgi:hypothetical protein
MLGGVKPQKAYPRALRILATLLARRRAYLVIVGGPVGRDGALAWLAVLAQARRLGVEPYVRLPGFVRDAARCLPAFDVVLNTGRYEGLSVGTLEALAARKPVVASCVGGQGEVTAPGLVLQPVEAPDTEWADAILTGATRRPADPIGSPVTGCGRSASPRRPRGSGVLFVTATQWAAPSAPHELAVALAGRVPTRIAATVARQRGVRVDAGTPGCARPDDRLATASITGPQAPGGPDRGGVLLERRCQGEAARRQDAWVDAGEARRRLAGDSHSRAAAGDLQRWIVSAASTPPA